MRMVGLKILKNKPSEYVRLAAAGETVLVTDRSRVVAELASYDNQLLAAARALGITIASL
jgi:prevent-host-death family protein